MKIALLIVFVVVFVWLIPLALLWMLNTLFGLELPYDLKHWAAALILGLLFGGSSAKK